MVNTHWILLTVAMSAALVAVAAIFIAGRMAVFFRRLEYASGDLQVVFHRLQRIAADLEGVARDVRATESRVSNTVNLFLDQAEPPVRVLTATLAGAKAGIMALVRGEASGADGLRHGRGDTVPRAGRSPLTAAFGRSRSTQDTHGSSHDE